MGFLKFLKKKGRKEGTPKTELEIPPAPPTEEELPEFPSPKEKPRPIVAVKKPGEERYIEKMEEEALETQEEVMEKRPEVKPVFVRVGAFKDVMDEIMLVNNIIKESEDTIIRVAEFKEDEDKEFKKWENQLKDIQQKLIYADQALFGTK